MQAEEQMVNLFSLGLVFLLMLLGAFGHWLNKKRVGEVSGNLIDYLFAEHPGYTMATGGSIFTAALVASMSGVADIIDPRLLWAMVTETASIPARSLIALALAVQSGWQLDSLINKGGKESVLK